MAPAADYFLTSGISLGGFLGFSYNTAGDNHSTRFSIGPRVGYNIVLSDLISLWPKLGLSFAATSATVATTVANTTVSSTASDTAIALNIFAPFMFHPVTHFFAGFGPFIDTDLSGDHRTTVWGGKLTIGGWFGGARG